jgi:phosphopantothenoylcysteine decarboxylase/phosphopantothenate--cysteine ligase
MAAAVADFRPALRVSGKLSRAGRAGNDQTSPATMALVANPDLLAELGRARRSSRPLLVGFAAEIGRDAAAMLARAREKLTAKGCDVVIANDVGAPGMGFGGDDNAVMLVFADGSVRELSRAPKTQIADAIWDHLLPLFSQDDRQQQARPSTRVRRAPVVRAGAARASRERGRRG